MKSPKNFITSDHGGFAALQLPAIYRPPANIRSPDLRFILFIWLLPRIQSMFPYEKTAHLKPIQIPAHIGGNTNPITADNSITETPNMIPKIHSILFTLITIPGFIYWKILQLIQHRILNVKRWWPILALQRINKCIHNLQQHIFKFICRMHFPNIDFVTLDIWLHVDVERIADPFNQIIWEIFTIQEIEFF